MPQGNCSTKRTIRTVERRPIEREAPAIMDRAPVNVPLQTGILAVDAMIPVGRGQRELILGDRQAGKTAIAIDTIINQRDKGIVSVYCAIGQQRSAVARVIADLRKYDAMKNCIVVAATGEDTPGLNFIAPYAATTMAEYFMEMGRDVLIVYSFDSRYFGPIPLKSVHSWLRPLLVEHAYTHRPPQEVSSDENSRASVIRHCELRPTFRVLRRYWRPWLERQSSSAFSCSALPIRLHACAPPSGHAQRRFLLRRLHLAGDSRRAELLSNRAPSRDTDCDLACFGRTRLLAVDTLLSPAVSTALGTRCTGAPRSAALEPRDSRASVNCRRTLVPRHALVRSGLAARPDHSSQTTGNSSRFRGSHPRLSRCSCALRSTRRRSAYCCGQYQLRQCAHARASAQAIRRPSARLQQIALAHPNALLIFPESVIPDWSAAHDARWASTFAQLNPQRTGILIGTTIPIPNTDSQPQCPALPWLHGASLLRSARAHSSWNVAVRRIAPRISAIASFSATIRVWNRRAGVLLCYEQMAFWPAVETMARDPEMLIAPSNLYWARNTPIPAIQHLAAQDWADLWAIPLYEARNL